MAGILDFFSPESGQRRRAALDQLGRSAEYYVPPELRQLLGFAAEMTPTATIDRAAQAGGQMLAPDRTPMQRVGDFGGMLSETAGVAAPMAVAGRAGMPVAQAVQEGLLGFSMGADDVGRKFVERMNQPGPVPTMYSNPVMGAPSTTSRSLNPAEQMAKDILDLRAAGRADEVTEEMMAQADPQYMFANTPLPMDEASRMARAEEAGFDTGVPLYHGTGGDFQAFDAGRFQQHDFGTGGAGVYSSGDPGLAGAYSDLVTRPSGDNANILPIVTRRTDAYDTGGYRNINSYEGSRAYSQKMQDLGVDNVFYRDNVTGEIIENTTFNPRNIRARFARFDPEFRHLRNLSAGVGGLGLLSTMLPQEEQY